MEAKAQTIRLFSATQNIRLNEALIAKARKFAGDVVSTVDYRDSNQSDLKKIEEDHFISKIGEEAVYAAFIPYQALISRPDYSIYIGKHKSWREDLTVNGAGLSVKTQKKSAAKLYGLSWTFQDSETRRDPILLRPESWVCLVECDDSTDGFSCRVFPPFQIRELTFRPPKLRRLIGKKQVIYAEDLPIIFA